MLILTTGLTSGQITFISRIIIQILSYGGAFLIGLIILGNSPRSGPKETHDVLNRVVGKSTATSKTTKWIVKRISKKGGDPTSKSLLFALVLFLLYGLFASLSDIGFLGLEECTVPYPSFETFPASIRTEADARALVQKNLVNGTNPKTLKFHQCDSASDVFINENVTERICSQWHNTTYDDPTLFRSLNLTDSDTLMYQNLGYVNSTRSSVFDLQNYYLGSSDHIVEEPLIRNGLAILPHDTGVNLVVGTPTLSKNQAVNIPKTMAIEIEMGCLSIGMAGQHDTGATGGGYDWFMPDSVYKPVQRSKFTGPEHLFAPLQTAADAARALILPAFNTSLVDTESGYIRSINQSSFTFTWQTEINKWFPRNGTFGSSTDATLTILRACSAQVHQAVNASIPSDPVKQSPQACGFFQLSGSWAEGGVIYVGYTPMVCASATAINMVSAKLAMDSDSRLTSQLSRLPSDLNTVYANYFDVIRNRNNDTVWTNFDQIQRYSLSDNPGGNLQHYIYQQYSYSSMGYLSKGSASPGYAISQIGGSMIDAGTIDNVATMLVINSTFFSLMHLNRSMVSTVTKWAGGFGASYMLGTFSMNGHAALDKPLTIQSTGGRAAVCYRTPYLVAFAPLIVAALVVILWSLVILLSAGLRDTKKWEELYGGLIPTKLLDIHSLDEFLVWDEANKQPHLRPLMGADYDGESEHVTMKLMEGSSSTI